MAKTLHMRTVQAMTEPLSEQEWERIAIFRRWVDAAFKVEHPELAHLHYDGCPLKPWAGAEVIMAVKLESVGVLLADYLTGPIQVINDKLGLASGMILEVGSVRTGFFPEIQGEQIIVYIKVSPRGIA